MTLEEFQDLYPNQYNFMYHHASCYGLLYECAESLRGFIYRYNWRDTDEDWAWEQVNDALYEWDI